MAAPVNPLPAVSLTTPEESSWRPVPTAHRRWEKELRIGSGEEHWKQICFSVLNWKIKTRSGFSVSPVAEVVTGAKPIITVNLPGFRILEPIQVLTVVQQAGRVGFAYRTLPGHPVSGEECFVVERRADGNYLLMRSLTRPSDVLSWRLLFPVLLLAQHVTRIRYFRALGIEKKYSTG